MTVDEGQDLWAASGDDRIRVGFAGHLEPTVVPGEAVYLVSQRGVTALHGEHAEVLAPLLDGSRTAADVLREAAARLGAAGARDSLTALERAGLLRRFAPDGARPPAPRGTVAYWDLAGLDGARAAAAAGRARVRIVDLTGTADHGRLRAACEESGLTVAEVSDASREPYVLPETGSDFAIVLCDDYLAPRLRDVDAAHRARGLPWLLARPGGAEPWVGPVFRPAEGGACWSCLAVRLRGHRRSERPLQLALGIDGPPPRPLGALASCYALGLHLAVLESAKWLAGVRDPAQDAVTTLGTLRSGSAQHAVTRLPQCAGCGDPGIVARRASTPFVPVSRPKAERDLGGHRALTPDQMLAAYGGLVDPVTGIVKEIRRAPNSPGFVHPYLSGHNLAMGSSTLAGLRAGLRALSGGKGVTETEARVSALCEAVERYSGTRHGDEAVVRDTFRALGDAAVHPNACQLYGERQFRDRDRWNSAGSRLSHVPERFDVDRPTEWTPVWSLTSGRQRLLPTSMLYYGDGWGTDGLSADSNGNAAGSSPEDALVQGFLELVERDAVALWWYNRTRQPAIDLDAWDEPYVDRIREGCAGLNREVWALDLTSDLGIPVVAALSRRVDKPAEDVIFGFGAHFDPQLAVRRALTEMGQLLPAVCDARPDHTGYRITDPEPLEWWRRATTAGEPYLAPDPTAPARTPAHWSYAPRGDLLDDIAAITGLVRAHGMELLVLDQTRPDLGLPVVKVIVPGLRPFWARFAPGRLYDVPVALGRRSEAVAYEDLNPVPLFV
ncbi:TOMM precursor leader peptide-binding protein [Streptomyces sp. NPDC058770]|uniref:TOMM precursor leader peptide-binding protein n=1 Tax=Streptomyces sp. NPDC058770 TaxID=3346631 RepID=UPI00368898C4